MKCWLCDSTDIVYVDAIECPWCTRCYEEVYLDDGPEAHWEGDR